MDWAEIILEAVAFVGVFGVWVYFERNRDKIEEEREEMRSKRKSE